MYHCHLNICLIGRRCETFEAIRSAVPPMNFSYDFYEVTSPAEQVAEKADAVFANLDGTDAEQTLETLIARFGGAQLIIFADEEQKKLSKAFSPEITDIWTLPMSAEEASFRFSRWQDTYRTSMDLWQTSQYLEATINGIPSLVWYKDKYGIHHKVNDSFCRTVGKSKKAVEGRDHFFIWNVDPNDPANEGNDCMESDNEVMRTRKTCVAEETVKTGGSIKLLTTYKSPLYDLDGSVMGTVGVGIDITQEREYEQEIISKNHALEAVFAAIDCGILCHAIDGARVLSVNRTALKILGYESQEELVSSGFNMVADSVVDEDKPVLRNAIKSLKKIGDTVSVEYKVRHKDGNILHVMGNIKLLSENGNPFYQRFLLDCTAQKLQEREKERRHNELVQALIIDYSLVCFFDLNTGLGFVLRAEGDSGSIFGSAEKIYFDEGMEKYIEKAVYSEDREMVGSVFNLDRLKKEMSEKNTFHINYRAVTDGGEIKYYEMRAVRSGSWGEMRGIVLGFRCVDEEIRTEMEHKQLLKDALLQANKASKAKSIFLSNMSHDIRTPMNAVIGFTNLAINHIDNREQTENYLEKIKTSGEHLLRLINDVLDMSQIESGNFQMNETQCSLSDILDSINNIVNKHITEKKLDFKVETEKIVHESFMCDKLRINQILINVISNSIKYTAPGGRVVLSIAEKPGTSWDNAVYEFRIKDNGIGMSKEFTSQIYELFARERNTTNSGIQGTGLGMAITKNIVDMMNGTIDVKSEQGAGTEVTICLNFRLGPGEALPEQKDAADDREKDIYAVDPEAGEKRILLVEDNELNQEIAAEILKDVGFASDIASNGKEAVDMVCNSEAGYYSAVLMDIQMPIMNGYEATMAIRGLDDARLAKIPIIAMTANAFEEDRRDALNAGMDWHISKPIDVDNLLSTLNKFIE